MDQHELIEAVEVLEVNPGDVLVFRYKDTLSEEQHEGIKRAVLHALKQAGHDHVPFIVMAEGCGFQVVRPH